MIPAMVEMILTAMSAAFVGNAHERTARLSLLDDSQAVIPVTAIMRQKRPNGGPPANKLRQTTPGRDDEPASNGSFLHLCAQWANKPIPMARGTARYGR